MSNHITVIAYGAPGSFVRSVQEDPSIAVDVIHALAALMNYTGGWDSPETHPCGRAAKLLHKYMPVMYPRPQVQVADPETCAHEWVCSGTTYGGDDESHHGEGRSYCSKCGADGDA